MIDKCYQCKESIEILYQCGICFRIACEYHTGPLGICEMCWTEEKEIADYGPYGPVTENLK